METGLEKVIFINSHPIQYFAPLYSFCNNAGVRVEAWYCSDESIKGDKDRQFGRAVKWDIPLLEGHRYRFFKNISWSASIHRGFFGLINPGLILALFKEKKSVVVVTGWGYVSYVAVILLAKLAGHTLCLRCETPLKQEKLHSPFKLFIRKTLFKHLMFKLFDKYLYVGSQNAAFCKYYGAKDSDLIFSPYSVDNCRFHTAYQNLRNQKGQLKENLGVSAEQFVILFSGKYIQKKRPLDLLKAFHLMENRKVSLVMIGEGELRQEMEQYIRQNQMQNVYLTGFINQSVIANYYAIGDVFVMCSQEGETWGLSVNEAMNFALPVVVSDMVGCSDDLVDIGENGYTFSCGSIEELKNSLNHLYENRNLCEEFGQKSKEKISQYSYAAIKDSLETLLISK